MNIVYKIQNYIYKTFNKYLPQNFSGILSGMIVGETTNISEKTKNNFQEVGITHLLAVSGSNVATVITFSSYIVIKIFGKRYSDYISILFIIFFVLISGASPSVVRAGIMAILNLFANITIRKNDSINNLILASFFILIYNPLALINIGFLLSFAGTVGIIVFSKNMQNYINKYLKIDAISEILSLNLSAQIMIFPIMLYFFNSFSLIGIMANLLIIPITSLLSFIGIALLFCSLWSFRFSKLLSYIIIPIVNYISTTTTFFTKFEFLNFTLPTPKAWMIVAFYILLYLLYVNFQVKSQSYVLQISEEKHNVIKSKLLKITYVLIITILIGTSFQKVIPKAYTEITSIDVGQGDSFLIVTENGKKILIDGGGSETTNYDVGKNILIPYLLDRGFMQIDYIFVSHAHADHIDGIYTVLENLKVKKVFIGKQIKDDEKVIQLRKIAKKNDAEIVEIYEGDRIKIDDIEIEILYPSKEIKEDNINNLSLIMKIKCNGREILFTGDAEKEVEEYLIKKYKKKLDADILKVGHHGAATSSSENFIQAVSPSVSLISVAKDNLYDHPNQQVVKRLQKQGKTLKTSENGEINIKIYNDGRMNIFPFL